MQRRKSCDSHAEDHGTYRYQSCPLLRLEPKWLRNLHTHLPQRTLLFFVQRRAILVRSSTERQNEKSTYVLQEKRKCEREAEPYSYQRQNNHELLKATRSVRYLHHLHEILRRGHDGGALRRDERVAAPAMRSKKQPVAHSDPRPLHFTSAFSVGVTGKTQRSNGAFRRDPSP